MTQEITNNSNHIFELNTFNNALNAFIKKHNISPEKDEIYQFKSSEEILNRTSIKELIIDLKKEYSEFWHIKENDIPYVKEKLHLFEIVNDITKLSGLGVAINNKSKNKFNKIYQQMHKNIKKMPFISNWNDQSHFKLENEYESFFKLLNHSEEIIKRDLVNSSFLLHYEANLGELVNYQTSKLSEFKRELKWSEKYNLNTIAQPTHKDILKGAFASIAYGVYISNKGKTKDRYAGFADEKNAFWDFNKNNNSDKRDIISIARELYQKDKKEITHPRNKVGNFDLG